MVFLCMEVIQAHHHLLLPPLICVAGHLPHLHHMLTIVVVPHGASHQQAQPTLHGHDHLSRPPLPGIIHLAGSWMSCHVSLLRSKANTSCNPMRRSCHQSQCIAPCARTACAEGLNKYRHSGTFVDRRQANHHVSNTLYRSRLCTTERRTILNSAPDDDGAPLLIL
jgi:hypothetical protein